MCESASVVQAWRRDTRAFVVGVDVLWVVTYDPCAGTGMIHATVRAAGKWFDDASRPP